MQAFQIVVWTGKERFAGTDANVSIVLCSDKGGGHERKDKEEVCLRLPGLEMNCSAVFLLISVLSRSCLAFELHLEQYLKSMKA